MNREIWRKRLVYARDRLCLYPEPQPLPRTRVFWFVMGLITLAVICFCTFYISYMGARHVAFQTNAEDFGIMDQSIWNTSHGNILHDSICNIIGDTNCASPDGYVRFAIHFEPILFPISWLYLLWSDPRVLFFLQTIVVASGAYPAFWLARLRLRNEWLGGAFAFLYLLYPAQLQATTSDFHAVTLTIAFLLFTLYFMYTRQTLWFFVFAILSMACKENIPLVVATIGLWSVIFQRRWKSGLSVTLLAVIWLFLATKVIMPHFSPTGVPLLSGRYGGNAGMGSLFKDALFHPLNFLHTYVFEYKHLSYIHAVLAPAGYIPKPHGGGIFYLPMLAPWILIMAVPSFAVNLLSSNPQQYSGLFHYNADLVPIIIFSTIEALVVVRWLTRVCLAELGRRHIVTPTLTFPRRLWSDQGVLPLILISLLLVGVIGSTLRTDYYFHGQLPVSIGFQWPQASAHDELAQKFIHMIPEDASVSAQTKLVPHLSHRKNIYMFPYAVDTKLTGERYADKLADYVLLDVTGDIYPYFESQQYITQVKSVLAAGNYGVLAAQDGYLLLKRGLPAPHRLPGTGRSQDPASLLFDLPESFCSNIYVSAQEVQNPLQVQFQQKDGGNVQLAGFQVGASSPFSRTNGYGTLTTYWRVNQAGKLPLQELIFLQGSNGREYFVSTDVSDLAWCPTQTWKPGSIVRLQSRTFNLQKSDISNGLAQMSIALLPQAQSSSTIMDVQARLPLQVLNAPRTVSVNQRTKALQLMPLTIVD
ncbi:hypothetical protein KDA_07870 [Dictyobacter alpinus]|uniref:Glycosyltransferase RgtA/B/C/D-like domain-containing protein n=1 Tax=Dictyobacter alpinus TaxID=2014873 RepID=A0A402B1S9_9CHLR|nr:DUF2079 domain-containing protein [Dictyobacter alpinus]GCE25303.1 hypothetical protein KDA_07870 [Dictyobacter alpinus]